MAAPAGVNEELPGEPAKAGQTEAETAEAAPLQVAEETEETEEEAAPAETELAEVVPPQAGPPETELAEVVPPQAGPAETESVEAEAEPVEAVEAAEAEWDGEEGRRDVSPLAVVGIILGVIALVGVAAGVLVVVTHGFRPKTVVTYRPAAVFGLRPGQCVNSGSGALKATVVSCARPHDAEVFAVFTLPAAPWPGASAVRVDADDGCASRFGGYIDPQLATASLTQEFVYPNQAAWQASQRTVVCEVSAVDGRLTGSVRATG
jgi:hypothetical protein